MSFQKSSLFKQTNSFRMTFSEAHLPKQDEGKPALLGVGPAFLPACPTPCVSRFGLLGGESAEGLGVRWETHTSFGVSAHGEVLGPRDYPAPSLLLGTHRWDYA